jgi:glycosyltransferase involved in cell wall biosynthesis
MFLNSKTMNPTHTKKKIKTDTPNFQMHKKPYKQSRQKILIIGHGYNPPFVHVYNQYSRLFDPARYEVTIALLTGIKDDVIEKQMHCDKVIFFSIPSVKLRGLKREAIKQVKQLFHENKFAMVVTHRFKAAYIISKVSKCYAIPHIVSVMHELGTLNRLTHRVFAYLVRKKLKFGAVSKQVADDMGGDAFGLKPKDILVFPNSLDVKSQEPQLLSRGQACDKLGITTSSFVFATIGRLVENKDFATLIEAFASLNFPFKVKLLIIGEGRLRSTLQGKINLLGLEQQVFLVGHIPEAYTCARAFDVFVSSAKQEAFGIVFLEAMLARLPIIATRTGGAKDILSHTQYLADIGDVTTLSSHLKTIYDLPTEKRIALGKSLYQHLLDNFSTEAFAKNFFTSLLESNQ